MKKYINERCPYFLHGGDYNPEQWIETKEIWDEDMRLMKKAHCNEMTVGMFSWPLLEPSEGVYDFSWLDEIIEKIGKNGGKVVLGTPSSAPPRWLTAKYPEVLRVNDRGERLRFGSRQRHCFTSPVYREKVKRINEQLALRYGKNPTVVAWHISNEYIGECHCKLCEAAFREFVKKRYDNDLKKLNHAYWSGFWGHTYASFDEVEPPSSLGDASYVHALTLDWKRFATAQAIDFMRTEIEPLRRIGADIPVTTNLLFSDAYDNNAMAEYIDIAAIDSYPNWHSTWESNQDTASSTAFWLDYYRSMKDRPFMLMESALGAPNWFQYNKLKRPGMDVLASVQAVAHGSDTVQYFQFRKSRGCGEKFHGSVVDHVGTENTRIFGEVEKTGKLLEKIEEIAGSGTDARVAILLDYENGWALEAARGFQNKDKKYFNTLRAYHKVFWKKGISVDVIGPKRDFSKYDLVVAPMQYMTDEALIEKFERYVFGGGTLYATYTLGMADESDLCHLGGFPGGKLKDVFGIWNEEIDTLYPEERGEIVLDNGNGYEAADYCELIHEKGATVLARYAKDFYKGMAAYTVNRYGKGKAYYQAFRDTGDFKTDALSSILEDLRIFGEIRNLPDGVTCHVRTNEQTKYVFVENYTEKETSVSLDGEYEDLLTGEKVEKVRLSAYGFSILKKQA